MAKNYTTKTASLKATTADIRNLDAKQIASKELTLNGKNILDYISDSEFTSYDTRDPQLKNDELDIWNAEISLSDNGCIEVKPHVHGVYAEETAQDTYYTYEGMTASQANTIKTAVKVVDNEVLGADDAHIMYWLTDGLISGEWIFSYRTSLTSFSSNLSSLTNGDYMFYRTALESFNGDLSSLTNGEWMFSNTALTSWNIDLPSLTNGYYMFFNTALTSWNIDLPSLTNGGSMFYGSGIGTFNSDLPNLTNGSTMFSQSALTSWNIDLPSLIDGERMFLYMALASFSGDLSSLTNGEWMFRGTALTSWNIDLPSLTNGYYMFYNTALESFNGDLSSLTNGNSMFYSTHARTYTITHYKGIDGVNTLVQTKVTATGLKSFTSNLSSLENGYQMFGDSAENASPLNEESIMIIADTIKDINGLGLTGNDGQLWLGYDTTITDTSKIMKYCDQIAAKGWTVYLNGATQVANNGVIETISLTNEDGSAIPYYYKPVQVTDEEIAEYVDADNNYYIIVGGQHVFGDDISTYGMFVSHQHAVSEITNGLGLTKYEKPSTENSDNN